MVAPLEGVPPDAYSTGAAVVAASTYGGDLGSTEAVKLVVACNGYSGPAKTRAAKN